MSTERFEKAVTKLYKAFHEGTLNPFSCNACAVGNIVGHGNWFGYGSEDLYCGKFDFALSSNKNLYPVNSDYSKDELRMVEFLFLKQWNGIGPSGKSKKELQFKGLFAVVEYLCELDNIPNVMDYSSLFEYDEQGAKKELQTVFP